MSLEDQKTSSKEIDTQIKSVAEDLKKSKKLSTIWDEN